MVAGYRERKILKRFQVTPISPILLLVVEVCIYMIYCAVSIITLFIAGRLIWKVELHGSFFGFMGSWLLTMVSTLSIGMMVGGIAKNEKSASVIASALYFSMLVFSGTTLPLEVMPKVLQNIVRVFPMTQGIVLFGLKKVIFLFFSQTG